MRFAFPSGKTTLAGTLTVPPGVGAHPAVVYLSGSGPTLREESHWLDGLFVSRGIAVLAYDKRGVGVVVPGRSAGLRRRRPLGTVAQVVATR